jgi:putative hydrolase of the HAD superfamily
MIETYRTHAPTICLHVDADEALTRLCGRYKLGLITDGTAVAQWAKIDALGLPGRLDEIIITAELDGQHAKPHPRAFELMAERLAVEPAACAYVADNPAKDFVAPNALGWTTVRIVRVDGIYSDEPPAEKGEPDHTITTLNQLSAIAP